MTQLFINRYKKVKGRAYLKPSLLFPFLSCYALSLHVVVMKSSPKII